jgi:ADP-ribose pyrophosphatase YjhB (NUDIX family)
MHRASKKKGAQPKPPRTATGVSEQAFLAEYDPKAFPPIAVAVDVALVSAFEDGLYTLLVERDEHPHKGRWALPGGFVAPDESLEATAARLLRDKAGVEGVYLEQLYTFGSPKRDPRMRVVSVAYYALVDRARFQRNSGTSNGHKTIAARLLVPWEGETGGAVTAHRSEGALPMAFDHEDIVGMVVKRLRGKLSYSPIGFQMLPTDFTLRQLQDVHEIVSGTALNKDSFRRRMLASGQLEATGERQQDVGHRPAELYRFVRRSAV